jgi:hypothetical protein
MDHPAMKALLVCSLLTALFTALGKRRKEFAAGEGPPRAERAGASESLGRGEGKDTPRRFMAREPGRAAKEASHEPRSGASQATLWSSAERGVR